jgi:uncharacterized protein (DUF488 family)
MTVYSIGYQQTTVDRYIDSLLQHKVDILVDVRDLPLSRKKGFSKLQLADALSRRGIQYFHFKSAGNPPHIRKTAKSIQECLQSYREYLDINPEGALDILALLERCKRTKETVCISCFEHDAALCHRSIITEKLLEWHPRANIVHLSSK